MSKIIITTDSGIVVDTLHDLDDYDLSKEFARMDLLEDVIDAITKAQGMEQKEEEKQFTDELAKEM